MAHELTHALQDQHSPLKKWENQTLTTTATMSPKTISISPPTKWMTPVTQCSKPGHGSVCRLRLKPANRSILNRARSGKQYCGSDGDTTGSPVMARAPLMLQETLVFPYSAGLDLRPLCCVRVDLRSLRRVMDAPPSSTLRSCTRTPIWRMCRAGTAHGDIHPLIDKDYLPMTLA